MEESKRILADIAFITIDIPSHTLPVLGYLSDLKDQGFTFDTYGPKRLVDKLVSGISLNAFGFEELEIKPSTQHSQAVLKSILEGFFETIPKIERIWLEGNKKPRLIIADMIATFALPLAKKHNIPLISFYSMYFVNNQIEDLNENFRKLCTFPIHDTYLPLTKQVEEKFEIKLDSLFDLTIKGDLNFSCLPKFVGDPVTAEREGYKYIGPLPRSENIEKLDFDASILDGNDIIYVSLGTAVQNQKGYSAYENIIEALGDSEHTVLISASFGKAEELIAKGLPKNIIVKSWVPQIKVLEHSKLFISHMGCGGFMEALTKGVPMIGVPSFGDQFINAQVIEKLNIGRYLKDKSSKNIKELVEEVLKSEKIKENSKKYKDMMNTEDSRRNFREIIKSMIK